MVGFFLEIADPISMGTTSLYAIQTCMGDAVLVRTFLKHEFDLSS
jgi:hypothetical protein